MDIAGFVLAQAIWSVCDTGPEEVLTPLVIVESPDGARHLLPFASTKERSLPCLSRAQMNPARERGRVGSISMSQDYVQEHIALVAKYELEFLAKRSQAERVTDAIAAFAGSLTFVVIHVVVFICWIGVNTATVGGIPHFDPQPFSALATLVTLEAILLASFILMRQSRLGRRADERDHLMLQLLLLMEKEITAVLGMDRHIAARMGLSAEANDTAVQQLSEQTSIEDVAQAIERDLPTHN